MLRFAVKYCGGCNPRYDRGAAYAEIRAALEGSISFSYPKEGESYDGLLIIRGCTGCPYIYEEIDARERYILADGSEIPAMIASLRRLSEKSPNEEG